MAKLFAGPWVGEFGWELFGWQGYLRKIAKDYDEIIICSRSGHEVLYEDFMTQYVPEDPKQTETDMAGLKGYVYKNIHDKYLEKGETWIQPTRYHKEEQEFIKFGAPKEGMEYDVLFHARHTPKHGTGLRNWPLHKWRSLADHLKCKIGCIGSIDASLLIEDTDDLRGTPLYELADVLASSKLLIGPSSGPIHFGSLCGTPHLVWGRQAGYVFDNKDRYETIWNPLNTPIHFIPDMGWDPSVQTVLNAIEKFNQI